MTLTKWIGTDFNWVHCTLKYTWSQRALVILSQDGNSNRSVKIFSSNSNSDNSPSPLKVLKLILSVDKPLVNLKIIKKFIYELKSKGMGPPNWGGGEGGRNVIIFFLHTWWLWETLRDYFDTGTCPKL